MIKRGYKRGWFNTLKGLFVSYMALLRHMCINVDSELAFTIPEDGCRYERGW